MLMFGMKSSCSRKMSILRLSPFTELLAKTVSSKKFWRRAACDKVLSKEKFREHNVVTPEWEVVEVGRRPTISAPLVVKAPRQGSTVGVVIVKDASELDSAMAE